VTIGLTQVVSAAPALRKRGEAEAPRYVPPLTGIRALAALLVLGFHMEQQVPTNLFSVLPFFARGDLGVDLFFILSGFIIAHVYLPSLAHLSWGAIQVFFWHRFVRLYPVHLAVLICLLVMVLLAGTRQRIEPCAIMGMGKLLLAIHLAACLGSPPSQWLESTLLVRKCRVVRLFSLSATSPSTGEGAIAPHRVFDRCGCVGHNSAAVCEFRSPLGAVSVSCPR
jgi:hypothetical protein